MSNIAVQREYEAETQPTAKRKAAVKIMKGIGASSGVAIGPCRVILRSKDLGAVKKGEILVFRTASRELLPHLEGLKGLVTEVGGQLTITAHYARLNEIPHVAGAADVMGTVTDGQVIRIDGSKGTVSLL
ncbi:MAG TPA: hypothetical protein DCR97_14885 [Deltaproteobacteria bacterium]|nr:hypothetical protein [Deltaproteobacteria bacterium]